MKYQTPIGNFNSVKDMRDAIALHLLLIAGEYVTVTSRANFDSLIEKNARELSSALFSSGVCFSTSKYFPVDSMTTMMLSDTFKLWYSINSGV